MKDFFLPLIFFIPLFLIVHTSCTNLKYDIFQQRVEENFSGNLNAPSNIDPAGVNSFSFSVLGDSHVGVSGGEILKQILQESKAQGDAFTVVAGDLTDSGELGQFKVFKNIVANSGFGSLVRVAIGNHDVFFGGWENYKAEIGKSIYSIDADNVHIAFIDSASGMLGDRQLKWLENDLASTNQTHKIVVTHFPAYDGEFGGIYRLNSDEEIAILKTILYRNNVSYFFSGHLHAYRSKFLGRTQFVVTGGANSLRDPGEGTHYVRVFVNGSQITAQKVEYP